MAKHYTEDLVYTETEEGIISSSDRTDSLPALGVLWRERRF